MGGPTIKIWDLESRIWWRNYVLRFLAVLELIHHSVSLSLGLLMDRLCLLDTVTTSSVSGRSLLLEPARRLLKTQLVMPLQIKKYPGLTELYVVPGLPAAQRSDPGMDP